MIPAFGLGLVSWTQGVVSGMVCVLGLITRLVKKSNLAYDVAGREGFAEMHVPALWLSSPGTPSGSPHLSALLHGLSSEGDRITPSLLSLYPVCRRLQPGE